MIYPGIRLRDVAGAERGNVLVVALILAVILAGFSVSALTVVTSGHEAQEASERMMQRLFLAEAGLDAGLADMNGGGTGVLGTAANPVPLGTGSFFTTAADNGDGTWTLTATGNWGGGRRGVRATVSRERNPFSAAIFAGNSSGDPNYTLEFGGTGAIADVIDGDIYSGGSVTVSDDASITGDIYVAGTITGTTGYEGHSATVPDINAMHYESNHDIDVAAEFAANQVYQADDAGGSAWQVPEAIPSHIFRKNPSDRATEVNGTTKNDYFLEDPYEAVRIDPTWDGSDAYQITLSGTGMEPGVDSNNSVFFIDGNLWIHNAITYSMKFVNHGGDPLRVTFVVKGNIYVADNVFYGDPVQDGVAFIAIADDAVPDSGNIYFGDPRGGTLETMYSFMYAENDFYDNNLSASGSDEVIVHGSMSAGNQVSITRDFANQRTQMRLTHDRRLLDGTLVIPGLPGGSMASGEYRMLMWQMTQGL